MKTIGFPNDPELIAAVDAIFARYRVELFPMPTAWKDSAYAASRRSFNGRQRPSSKSMARKRRSLAKRDGARCAYCGGDFADLADATLDHLIPYRLVKSWAIQNLVLACGDCNTAKDDHIPAVLMALISHVVYRIAVMNGASVERSLVPVKAVAA
ncbi:HNH endonuclease [Streptomyces sp. NBC_01353]|uniref:HNH endonuclease n=1 Tax=Streptomyces sp. NBC_01353 TaxID=2903835 RepID=UPI002E31D79B|nr:HNH endonuclease [Streptomyces sp. NBC_01353]